MNIEEEFTKFIEFPDSENKDYVTTTSTKLFAKHCVSIMQKRIDELEQQNAELVAHCEVLKLNASAIIEEFEEIQGIEVNGISFDCVGDVQYINDLITLINRTPKQSLANIKSGAIKEFKAHIKSGLEVATEPSWHTPKKLVIDDNTYIEIKLSEFDDYANQLRDQ